MQRTRTQKLMQPTWIGQSTYQDATSPKTTTVHKTWRGYNAQITDEVHPQFLRRNKRKGPTPDLGGDMVLHRWDLSVKPVMVQTTSYWVNQQVRTYTGYMICTECGPGVSYPYDGNSTYSYPEVVAYSPLPVIPSLSAMGTLGWNKFKPTAPKGALGTGLAELMREGLPVTLKEILELRGALKNLSNFKKMGDRASGEFLRHQFGVLPLISDVKDLINNIRDMDKNLQQLIRDNGKPVRRRGLIRRESSNTTVESDPGTPWGYLHPILFTGHFSGNKGKKTHTTSTTNEWYFSGQFRYWIDPKAFGWKGLTDKQHFALERILLGLDPTDPEMWWSLIPWSWLIDWALPIGGILANLNDSKDSLVADYAYVSVHSKKNVETTRTFYLNDGIERATTSCVNSEARQRIHASPYGFGLTISGLSTKRLAILAALGWQRLS